jgi:hypothetical protein
MQTAFLDKTRMFANILLVVLVAMNIFFSFQYTQNINKESVKNEEVLNVQERRTAAAEFLRFFIDRILFTNGTISFEDRVKFEADIIDLKDEALLKQWKEFIASPDSETAQRTAVKMMSMLANRMLI